MNTQFKRMFVMLILFFSFGFDVKPALPEKTFQMLDNHGVSFGITAYDCYRTTIEHQVMCELDTGDPFTLNVTFENIDGLVQTK